MNRFFASAGLLVGLFSGAAFAAGQGHPLISKISQSGMRSQSPGWARQQTCEIYQNKAVVVFSYGLPDGGSTSVSREVPLTVAANIGDLVKAAAAEKLDVSDNQDCGFAHSDIVAGDVVLFSSGGCGQPHKFRSGPSSLALVDIANMFCPKTFY
jgi:hypothetical protein